MRAQSLTLAVAGLALMAPAFPSSAASPTAPPPLGGPAPRHGGAVSAADLLARVRDCTPVSQGRYRTDHDTPATVPVCATGGVVFWKADLDIDCDGRPGRHCNARTDPLFAPGTAFQQSDGRDLSAETLPYVVVPAPSDIWDHRRDGVHGGSVAAVVYGDRVQYAVVGDVGPDDIIGEASYATAVGLGIRPDPHGGGTPSGVTYIVFRDSEVKPIEDRAAAVATGERLARLFVRGDTANGATATPDGPAAPAATTTAGSDDPPGEAASDGTTDPAEESADAPSDEEPDGQGADTEGGQEE
ncbi:hypothetical protein HF200_26115 [Streptomyces galbus]|uniref:Glycoside hydrolase family 75 protein n=1 Tax=Streptomyces galbus TaxID=33898 RepID=A0ABX1IU07_STRGB|nr:hypothetical protein [Streptomyces galbus]